jgi:hypothetical protein
MDTDMVRCGGLVLFRVLMFVQDPENDVPSPQGSNWWKALIYVDGKRGDWIEFKLVKTRGLAGDGKRGKNAKKRGDP